MYLIMPLIYRFYIGNNYIVEHLIYAALLFAYFFNGLYRFKVGYLFFHEKTFTIASLSFVTAATNLIFNYIYIDKLGILGAAISTLISYLALYILLEIILFNIKKDEKTPIKNL